MVAWLGYTQAKNKRPISGINVRKKTDKLYSILTINNKTTVNESLCFLVIGFILYKTDLL